MPKRNVPHESHADLALQRLMLSSPEIPRETRWFAYSLSGVLSSMRDDDIVYVSVEKSSLVEHGTRLLGWPHIRWFQQHKITIEDMLTKAVRHG